MKQISNARLPSKEKAEGIEEKAKMTTEVDGQRNHRA